MTFIIIFKEWIYLLHNYEGTITSIVAKRSLIQLALFGVLTEMSRGSNPPTPNNLIIKKRYLNCHVHSVNLKSVTILYCCYFV